MVAEKRSKLPSVDHVLGLARLAAEIDLHGRGAAKQAVRAELDALRRGLSDGAEVQTDDRAICAAVTNRLAALARPSLRPLFNLTGTVLHTNLGRAPLPAEAMRAMEAVAGSASNLEYDLASGKRGDRDVHVEDLLRELTGAEAATVVNNNAAAVLLVLNSLTQRKEVPVSRGELIEIGGAFRLPDVMKKAGCKLIEVGTTNRTHAKDYAEAISPRTGAFLKVHTSNYVVEGFTKSVGEKELAVLGEKEDVPLIVDLGAGALVDLMPFGLPREPIVSEVLAQGAAVVTFSGDKLLGGPQAGLIAGRADLIAKIKRNPMKRALRLDKLTIAALEAVLRLYRDPERLTERLPALGWLARPADAIKTDAERLRAALETQFGDGMEISVASCLSQIGSGALPVERLPSFAVVLRPAGGKRGAGARLKRLAGALRDLEVPVIGRIKEDALWLDLRCLDDPGALIGQLANLGPPR